MISVREKAFIEKLNKVNPTIQYISGFVNAKSPVECRCKICNNTWNTSTPSNLTHSTRPRKCPRCSRKSGTNLRTLTQEQFLQNLQKVQSINPHLQVLSVYKNAKTKVEFHCDVCGSVLSTYAEVLMERENYCPVCNKKHRYTTDEFIEKMGRINNSILIKGTYISTESPIDCECKICGAKWKTRPNGLLRGSGCPECSITGTSFFEQLLLWSFRRIYGNAEVLHRDKSLIGRELDIYIPSVGVAIEPGGWFWHESKQKEDIQKQKQCLEKGVRCLIIYDQCKEELYDHKDINDIWFFSEDLGKNLSKVQNIIDDIYFELSGEHIVFENEEWEDIVKSAKEQNTKRHDMFIQKLVANSSVCDNIKIKGKYFRNTDPIECECKICGYGSNGEWKPIAATLLQGSGCPMCAGNIKKSTEQFKKEMKRINSSIETIGNYINRHTPIECHSTNCGHSWKDVPQYLLEGRGCPICTQRRVISHAQFVERVRTIRPDLEVIGIYKDSKTPVACKCKICGYGTNGEWLPLPSNLYMQSKCKRCSMIDKSESRCRKVINLDTKEVYNSLKEAERTLGEISISSCVHGITKTAGGYHWSYYES